MDISHGELAANVSILQVGELRQKAEGNEMILYEVSGSRLGLYFTPKWKDAQTMFQKEKEAQNDAELRKVRVEVSAARQLELLNGYWANAREEIAVIDSYDPRK